MKKLFLTLFVFFTLSIVAENFNEEVFYDLLQSKKYEEADSLLTRWEKEKPDNPELYPARFNFYINRAHSSVLVLDNDTTVQDEALFFSDSTGQVVGSFRSEENWDEELVKKAFEAIDKGISHYPDRLDFYFGKASAAKYTDDWDLLSATIEKVIDRSLKNDCRWKWTNDSIFDQADARNFMLESIHDFEATLYEFENPVPLLTYHISAYPEDELALTMMGAVLYNDRREAEALEYMERAHRAAPEDPLIILNLALMYSNKGENETAKAFYQKVIESPTADNELKEAAQAQLLELNNKN